MAIMADLSLMSSRIMGCKNPNLTLKDVSIILPTRVCLPGQKMKKKNGNFDIKAVMQVEEMKSVASLGLDVVSEGELREKGFLGLRKTKLICTIGPACCSLEDLKKLGLGGMNVARLNMCHNTRDWHCDVIRKIKKLNEEHGFCISLMIDTEGSQHVVDHGVPSSVKAEVT